MTCRTLPVQPPDHEAREAWTPERIARHRIGRAAARALSEMHEAHLAARQLPAADRQAVRDHLDTVRAALARLDTLVQP